MTSQGQSKPANSDASHLPRPESMLILHNVTKDSNFGFLFRTAAAFGVSEILIAGKRNFELGGACGTGNSTRHRHFHRLVDACDYVRALGADVCGIEIDDQARSIDQQSFQRSTAFLVGNEGSGLSAAHLALCDYLVYVPQYGTIECLNVNVAAGIVLHRFASTCGFAEATRAKNKFRPTEPTADTSIVIESPQ